MAVGIGMKGNEVTCTHGGITLAGKNSKGITLNNTALDVTDDASGGWRELLAVSGQKSVDFPLSGTLKNLELAQMYFGSSQIAAMVYTFPEGSTISGDGFLESFSIDPTGSDDTFTWSANFISTGAIVFVAGT